MISPVLMYGAEAWSVPRREEGIYWREQKRNAAVDTWSLTEG